MICATYDYVDLYRISWRDEHRSEYPKITTRDVLLLLAHRRSHINEGVSLHVQNPDGLEGLVGQQEKECRPRRET